MKSIFKISGSITVLSLIMVTSICISAERNATADAKFYSSEEAVLKSEKTELTPAFFSALINGGVMEGMVSDSEKNVTDTQIEIKRIDAKIKQDIGPLTKVVDPALIKLPTSVRSHWADSNMVIGGVLSPAEWGDAGKMKIPGGYLMVKNDDTFMYIALDLIDDDTNDPGTGDYFWFSIDIDKNLAITPRRDTNYGLYVDQPNRMGRQYYLGPGRWTGLLNETSPSACHIGFGISPNAPDMHRVWEIRIALTELGIEDITALDTPPVIKFGVRVHSTRPSFTYNIPANFYTDFSALRSIYLATQAEPDYTSGASGSVIGGVGLIPFTQIVEGYATTDPSYLNLDEAAFAGRLDFIGNSVTMQDLWDAGARKYRIYHRAGSSGSYSAIRQSWSNYRWTGAKYVLEHFGPDSENKYPLLNPGLDYSIDDLLIRWKSNTYASGLHSFYARFYDEYGTIVPVPLEILTLMVDNYLPEVDIVEIRHDGYEIPACSIEEVSGLGDGVQVKINVNDPEGHLRYYELTAHFGEGDTDDLGSDTYAAHRNPTHLWSGTSGTLLLPPTEWAPPYSCAYQFRLTAYPRTTNGYGWVHSHRTDTHHVTLIVPEP